MKTHKSGPVVPIRSGLTRQSERLVEAGNADPELGFMARMMVLCSLPRRDPGKTTQYERVNGPYTLIMSATGKYKFP